MIAIGMAVATAYLIRWAATTYTPLRASAVVFLLLMMGAMFAGFAVYVANPTASSAVEGLWVASALMSASVLPLFFGLRSEIRQRREAEQSARAVTLVRRRGFVLVVLGLVIGNELLMGWTFQAASSGALWAGETGVGGFLSALLVNPWFVLPMAVEMGCALAWLRHDFRREMLVLLAFQPVVMFASPPSIENGVWVLGTAAVSSAMMATALGYLLLRIYRGEALSRPVLEYAIALLLTFGLMAGGLVVWAVSGGTAVYAVSVVGQMALFLYVLLASARYGGPIADHTGGNASGLGKASPAAGD